MFNHQDTTTQRSERTLIAMAKRRILQGALLSLGVVPLACGADDPTGGTPPAAAGSSDSGDVRGPTGGGGGATGGGSGVAGVNGDHAGGVSTGGASAGDAAGSAAQVFPVNDSGADAERDSRSGAVDGDTGAATNRDAGGFALGDGGVAPARPRAAIHSSFDDGSSLLPFKPCWSWAPNYAKVVDKSVEFFYSQAGYDANPRREMKGAEICGEFETFTDGWYGFKLYVPSPGFPTNSTTIVTQVFQKGDCNSWAAHLDITNRDLVIQHRSSCGKPTEAVVYPNLPVNTWVPVIMYFKASNNGNGALRVWVNGAPKQTPSYDLSNINFGFGQWTNGTTLAPGNSLGHKMGIYTMSGGDKRIRLDDISLQPGNPTDAYERVSP